MLKKIVIVAEGAAGAGLTEDAGFPMMKNQRKLSPRRHGGTENGKSLIFGFLCFCFLCFCFLCLWVSPWLCAFVVE